VRSSIATPTLPEVGTTAFSEYLISWHQINRFYQFVLTMVSSIEHVSTVAHEALVSTEHDETKRIEMISQWEIRRGPVHELKENRQFFLEVIYVQHVENFLAYLSGLLFDVFTQRPETLRSSEKVDIASVLKHDSIESLVRELAERKVEALSYSSFADLSDFFHERFGLRVGTDVQREKITEAIEIRNISVHNRCLVSKRFTARLPASQIQIGQRYELYVHHVDRIVPLLLEFVRDLDQDMIRKLSLTEVRLQNETDADQGVRTE
jgi:hypothetical protein